LIKKIQNRILLFRIFIIKKLLLFLGFIDIRGHWIYAPGLNSDSVLIDLGANLGEFSKSVNKLYDNKCYLIEPNFELFKNINDCALKLNVAITSKDGIVKFNMSKNHEASSLIFNFENKWGHEDALMVEGISWKTCLNRLNLIDSKINILKIDIEGGELDLIESFTDADLKKIDQLTIEFHDWINWELHTRTISAIKKLISKGYLFFSSTPNHLWPLEIVFIKREQMSLSIIQKINLYLLSKIMFLKY